MARIVRYFRQADPLYLEMALGAILAAWIVMLIMMPSATVNLPYSIYDALTLHHRGAVESVGAMLSMMQLAIAVIAVLCKKCDDEKVTTARLGSAFLQTWFWAFLSFNLYSSTAHYLPPGLALYGGIAVSHGFLVWVFINRLVPAWLVKHTDGLG